MKRKLIVAIMTGAMSIMLLAGCGGTTETKSAERPENSSESSIQDDSGAKDAGNTTNQDDSGAKDAENTTNQADNGANDTESVTNQDENSADATENAATQTDNDNEKKAEGITITDVSWNHTDAGEFYSDNTEVYFTLSNGQSVTKEIPLGTAVEKMKKLDIDGDGEEEIVIYQYFANTAGEYSVVNIYKLTDGDVKEIFPGNDIPELKDEIVNTEVKPLALEGYPKYMLEVCTYQKDEGEVSVKYSAQLAFKDGSFKEIDAEAKAQESASKGDTSTMKQCEDEISLLLGTKPVHPSNEEILKAMCDCATTAGVIDKSGVIFSKMNNDERARLRYRFLEAVMWQSSILYEDLAVKIDDATWGMPLDEARKMFSDAYGEDDFTPTDREQIKNDNIIIPFADGEPVDLVVGMQFFEDDDYILISGPLFYESNGEGELFKGCADILLAKNNDSRFGATLVYGRCRDVNIEISSVEASSELKGSGGKSYSAKNLIDGDPSTVWAEGSSGTGVGETITLHLDKKQPVYGIQLVNGYTAGYEQYINNGTLTSVKVDFGGGVYAESNELEGYGSENFTPQDLADMNRFRIGLDEPVTTDTIKITITGAAKGQKYDDVCVSEVWVYGPGEVEINHLNNSGDSKAENGKDDDISKKSLAERMVGKYCYHYLKDNKEDEYYIMNVVNFGDNLYAYCGKAMPDVESYEAYSFWATEFIPYDANELSSTKTEKVKVNALSFSIMSNVGKYWDSGHTGTITLTDDGLVFEGFDKDGFLVPDDSGDSRLFSKNGLVEDFFSYLKDEKSAGDEKLQGYWRCVEGNSNLYIRVVGPNMYIYEKDPAQEVFFAAGGCDFHDGSFNFMGNMIDSGGQPFEFTADYKVEGDSLFISVEGTDAPRRMYGKSSYERISEKDIHVTTMDEVVFDEDSFGPFGQMMKEPFYGLWVNAFKNEDDARTLVAELKDKDLPAFYVYSCDWENLNKDPYYCVTIGKSDTKEEAESYKDAAKAAGYKSVYVKHTGDYIK